jgi:CIC family chloride channel protein
VLFALEEIIGDMNAALLGSTVVASVAAVIVERSILGNEPLFHVPTYRLVNPLELLAYAGLGVIGGALSLVFCKGLLAVRQLFQRMPATTRVVQPAIGGLIIGGILLYSPAIMGVGYEYVDQALNGGLLLRTMAILCLLKLGATVVSYASGNAGGIFAPSLYIGAMAGGAVGALVHRFAPVATGDPGAYALVGMGTLFAGIIRAPMTSVFMIFEITQDYQILVPLMVANLLSFVISRRFQPVPVYHALLHQDGIHLPSSAGQTSRTARRARHVMTAGDESVLSPDLTIADAWRFAQANDHSVYLVGAPAQLVGAVTWSDLDRLHQTDQASEPILSIAQQSFVHAHPDHPMDIVLERLEESGGLLPVVSRTDAHRLEGVITADTLTHKRRRRAEKMPS